MIILRATWNKHSIFLIISCLLYQLKGNVPLLLIARSIHHCLDLDESPLLFQTVDK
jgi:hypothetical protein